MRLATRKKGRVYTQFHYELILLLCFDWIYSAPLIIWEHKAEEASKKSINITPAELNPICHLLALLGAHHILHVNK